MDYEEDVSTLPNGEIDGNLDEILWPKQDCSFRHMYRAMSQVRVQRIVDFVREMWGRHFALEQNDPELAATMHFAGFFSLLPRNRILHTNAITRLIEMIPPAFFDMIMASDFSGPHASDEVWAATRDQAIAAGINQDRPGGGYFRGYMGQFDEMQRIARDFLAVARTNYLHLERFFRMWLDRNQGCNSQTQCCVTIGYFGEVSTGTVNGRFLQEDHPTRRDGAALQWEFFNWINQIEDLNGSILKFQFWECPPVKRASWILEAFVSGLHAMASSNESINGGVSTTSLANDATGLNSVNCGRPHFLDKLFGSRYVLDWLKKVCPDRTRPLCRIGGVPLYIPSFIRYNSDALREYINNPLGRFQERWPDRSLRLGQDLFNDFLLTGEQLLSFLGHLGGTATAASEGLTADGKSKAMVRRGRASAASEGLTADGKSKAMVRRGRATAASEGLTADGKSKAMARRGHACAASGGHTADGKSKHAVRRGRKRAGKGAGKLEIPRYRIRCKHCNRERWNIYTNNNTCCSCYNRKCIKFNKQTKVPPLNPQRSTKNKNWEWDRDAAGQPKPKTEDDDTDDDDTDDDDSDDDNDSDESESD